MQLYTKDQKSINFTLTSNHIQPMQKISPKIIIDLWFPPIGVSLGLFENHNQSTSIVDYICWFGLVWFFVFFET